MNNTSSIYSVTDRLFGLLKLIRPKQWVKNGFVFAPLIFSGELLNPSAIRHTFFAALLFCVASSATYIVNDLRDIEADKHHPKKSKSRPLASGLVSKNIALIVLGLLYFILACGYFVMPKVILVIAVYLILNFAYTFFLKHEPVLDIFTIAIGFVLRVIAGAAALNVVASVWMCVTTLCLALYLAAVKRRQELAQSGADGRKVLAKYSVALVDRYAEMSATGALLFYSMFVMSTRPELAITIPLVLYGLFRYWYVVEALDGGESPTDALLADWQLMLVIALWVAACVWALSGLSI
ncbi:decaprenyl-phosphate phosphoribosyltransferase [Polynucleobacter paneuropaeus]|nr:decaprenyl-phosphate phosphoribosyltransferase [Polynucleobacter paneuropaeus]